MAFGGEVREQLGDRTLTVQPLAKWRCTAKKLSGQDSKLARSACKAQPSKFRQIPGILAAAETLRTPILSKAFSGHGLLLGGHFYTWNAPKAP